MCSELANMPVHLDLDALRRHGVSPLSTLKLDQPAENLGRVMINGLEPLGLTVRPADSFVRITDTQDNQPEIQELAVGDLLAGGAGDEITRLVMTFVAPGTWGDDLVVANDQLAVRRDANTIRRTRHFLDRLRVARRLPPQEPLPEHLGDGLTLRMIQAKRALQAKLTVNRPTKTPLTTILGDLQSKAGVTIIVDWSTLAPLGWTPDADSVLVCDEESLARALALLLTPMRLDFYVADAKTLVVTTQTMVDETADVEFHAVGDLLDSGIAIDTLTAALRTGLKLPPVEGEEDGRLVFEPVGRRLIARLPQRLQVTLAGALARIRARR